MIGLYLPPLIIVSLAIGLILVVFTSRVPVLVIAILAIVLILFTVFQHLEMFNPYYRTMDLSSIAGAYATPILITVIILIAIGYILFLMGIKRAPNAPIPEEPTWSLNTFRTSAPNFSRNLFTNNLGSPAPINNTMNRSRLYSALNRAV